MRLRLRALCLGILCFAAHGCANPPSARYVYQDGEFGVIGIPRNTFLDKKMDYRAEAEILMARHFPEGYEIVRAEEVNEGQRLVDLGRKTEIGAEPNLNAFNQMLKLGKVDRVTSFEEKDQLPARECRIIYKRRLRRPGDPVRFSEVATLSPELYLDPNEAIRRECNLEKLAKNDAASKKATDPDVKKTAGGASK